MKGLSLSNPRNFLALLVRRKWWILVPFIGLSLAVALLTHLLPWMYVSESLILIQPRGVPEDFVKDLIAGSTEQRLSAIEKTVLSRTNLLLILDQFEANLPEVRRLNGDQKVLKLREEIKVAFEAERRMGVNLPLTYFRISYQNRNPELAQQIASKLTSLFIEQDTRVRDRGVAGTTEFFSEELDKVAEQLKQSDAKLAALKRQHMNELPAQLETNLRTLDRLNLQKQANGESLDRSATLRLNLERLLSETPPLIPQETPRSRGTLVENPLVESYRKKELDYRVLSAKYTSSHPDVQRAKAELERLKKEIPPEDLIQLRKETAAETSPVMVPNPVYQNLTAQLRELKTEFEIREREKKWIDSEIAKYSERVQNAPAREQDMAAVLRSNGELTKQYEDLKSKLAQAKLSQSLESGQRGSQFVVIDPANYPLLPAKPNKLLVILAGMVMSLVTGVCVAAGVDLLNQKIWTQTELEQLFDVQVLAEIPEIITDADVSLARKKRLAYAALSFVFGTAYLGGLYFIYLKQMRVLHLLDPIIQRLIYTT